MYILFIINTVTSSDAAVIFHKTIANDGAAMLEQMTNCQAALPRVINYGELKRAGLSGAFIKMKKSSDDRCRNIHKF